MRYCIAENRFNWALQRNTQLVVESQAGGKVFTGGNRPGGGPDSVPGLLGRPSLVLSFLTSLNILKLSETEGAMSPYNGNLHLHPHCPSLLGPSI